MVEASDMREKIRTHRHPKEGGRVWRVVGDVSESFWEQDGFEMSFVPCAGCSVGEGIILMCRGCGFDP